MAGDHLEQHHAQSVEIGAFIDQRDQFSSAAAECAQVFRSHVGDRAAERRFDLRVRLVLVMRQIEIEQHRCAVRTQQNVARLDVAVQHAAIVRVLESIGEPRDDPGAGAREVETGDASNGR